MIGKNAIVWVLAIGLAGWVFGGETEHYPNGIEGMKAASRPPPGVYSRTYFYFYESDDYKDKDGKTLPLEFDLKAFVAAERVLWVTPVQILGANYSVHFIMPIQYTHLKMDAVGLDADKFGAADLYVSPLTLAWHGERYDLVTCYDLVSPIGTWDKDEPASPSKDMFTHIFTFGGTGYLDHEKTWTFSMLARYEIHMNKMHMDYRPGDSFHFEWGAGKDLKVLDGKGIINAGIAGYAAWQTTDDKGRDVVWDPNVHDQAFAAGPEIGFTYAPWCLSVSVRHEREFLVKDRPEGSATVLMLTKGF